MILCLELSQETERDRTQMSPQERDDLLQLLETTYKIFREGRHRSSDTHRGYVALRIMLGRVRGSPVQSGSSMSDEQIVQVDSKSIILFISSYPTETNLVRRSIDIPTGASFNRSAAISDVYIEQRGPADCRLCLRRSAVSLITRSDWRYAQYTWPNGLGKWYLSSTFVLHIQLTSLSGCMTVGYLVLDHQTKRFFGHQISAECPCSTILYHIRLIFSYVKSKEPSLSSWLNSI